MAQTKENLDKLTWRSTLLAAIVAIVVMFDFYDFNVLGFIIGFISKPWNLTVGQATWIIGTSGVGVVIGGFTWGYLSDKFGRRNSFIISTLIYSLGSAAMALAWTGAWEYLSLLRVFVGFGVAGAFTIAFPLVSEFVPKARRGAIVGLTASFVPLGTLLASTFSATLTHTIGWQGLALIAGVPAVIVLALYVFVPESPRWLVTNGREDEAKAVIAKISEKKPEEIDLAEYRITKRKYKYKDVFKYKRSLVSSWLINLGTQSGSYTLTLFGATLLIAVLGISATEAAFLFIFVALAGFLGRLVFSMLNDILGRRFSGYFMSVGLIIGLMVQAVSIHSYIGGISVFYLMTVINYFLINGSWPITTALGSEEWPQEIRSSGWGSSYGFGGIGKIIGPVGLGLLLGSGLSLSKPKLVEANIGIGVAFLAAIMVLALIGFILAFETKGKSLEAIDEEIVKSAN